MRWDGPPRYDEKGYLILDNAKIVAKTIWGCSCCEPEAEQSHYDMAAKIVLRLNAAG